LTTLLNKPCMSLSLSSTAH